MMKLKKVILVIFNWELKYFYSGIETIKINFILCIIKSLKYFILIFNIKISFHKRC